MGLKRDEYWWIENEKGELATYGRMIDVMAGECWRGGAPNMTYYRRDAKELCYTGERPVKVKIVRVV